MSDEQQNTPETAQTQPRTRRSRRATAPAMTPDVATETAPVTDPQTAENVADTAAEAPSQPDAEAAPEQESPPARKPRAKRSPRRKTTSGSVDSVDSADQTVTDSDSGGSGDSAPTGESSAAVADVSSPSAGAEAKKVEEPSAPDDAASAEGTQSPAEEDKPARKRRSGGRRAVSTGGTPQPVLDVFAAFGVTADEEGEADEQASNPQIDLDLPERETTGRDEDEAVVHEAQDDEEESEPEEAASSDDDSPRLPATALLFQAPDPSRGRRRRKATSDAGAPKVHSAPDGDADDTDKSAGDNTADSESAEGGQQDEASSDEQTGGGGKRRRRRGGRGRRKSGGGQDQDDQDQSGQKDDADEGSDSGRSGSGESSKGSKKKSGKGKGGSKDSKDTDEADQDSDADSSSDSGEDGAGEQEGSGSSRRRRRRRSRGSRSGNGEETSAKDEVTALKGSTRLEAKRQRRREGRDSGRRRSIITEAEFLARRESVERSMVVRERDGRTQIAVLEDDVLVEHYVARKTQSSMVGNVYLGRVQNVLPSMEAAFVDLGKGRNAVLYAGEVNWDAAGLEGQPRRIEQALSSGDSVLVQVTKDPIGHKGARLTAQVTLAGRYLVLVPSGSMTGISRKLPDTERQRLKKLLKEIVPEGQGVIVRTAAEGASEEALRRDVERLTKQWDDIQTKVGRKSISAPVLLKGEPELSTRVVRDVFNEDFKQLVVAGDEAWKTISDYVGTVAPDLSERLSHWTSSKDVFAEYRIDEQLAKGMDRKVWLPSGGSLVIDRTEAMTVVDVNTGKFTGSGGTLEETVTKNNLEAAEEIVRQLRLRDIGGIIVVDFIDMVLEANRDLVMRRLVECLGRDRTRHQVAEVTSLGLVQMTRKRVGQGLVEAFSETCEHCNGRGFLVHSEPVESSGGGGGGKGNGNGNGGGSSESSSRPSRRRKGRSEKASPEPEIDPEKQAQVRATLATIAAAAAHAHEHEQHQEEDSNAGTPSAPVAADSDASDSDASGTESGEATESGESAVPKGDDAESAAPKGDGAESAAPKGDDAESAAPQGDDAGTGTAQVDAVDPPNAEAVAEPAQPVSHAEALVEPVPSVEEKPAQ
ncbi:Rne/Rng family ribonuclease [Ruania rhizosphaerae]|uniref:Rne/Rng family ribonuclease n=1 Tax=Ruania rhizosphaerae TaxID=1840413 RepID=UPI001F1EE6FF|nr:Rne/Rng family ribonuclease [Ruania rhizosphaerae]